MIELDLPPVEPGALRDELRRRLGVPGLDFAEAPARIASGAEAVVEGFRLAGLDDGDPAWRTPLVLRRLFRQRDPAQLRWEAAVHGALHDQGFPVPRVLCVELEPGCLGSPFLIAQRVPGEVMLQAVMRPGDLVRRPWRIPRLVHDALRKVPAILGEAQARLHRVDPRHLRDRLRAGGLDPAEIGFDARLAGVRRRADAAHLDGLAPGIEWLERERPREARSVICHGDFVFTNLCVMDGRVTGVFDWSTVTLAEPAYDLSASHSRLRSRLPGLPAALDRISRRTQAALARRYLAAYGRQLPVDRERLRYYDAYWLLYELSWSGARLRDGARFDGAIEHRWLHPETIDAGVAAFRERTGIELAPLRPPG